MRFRAQEEGVEVGIEFITVEMTIPESGPASQPEENKRKPSNSEGLS